MRIDGFRPIEEFKATMDDLLRRLKDSPKAEGQQRIWVHGEKEFEMAEERRRRGIPLHPKVASELRAIAEELEVEYDLEGIKGPAVPPPSPPAGDRPPPR